MPILIPVIIILILMLILILIIIVILILITTKELRRRTITMICPNTEEEKEAIPNRFASFSHVLNSGLLRLDPRKEDQRPKPPPEAVHLQLKVRHTREPCVDQNVLYIGGNH